MPYSVIGEVLLWAGAAAELADARDSKSRMGNHVWVRVPPLAVRWMSWEWTGASRGLVEFDRRAGNSFPPTQSRRGGGPPLAPRPMKWARVANRYGLQRYESRERRKDSPWPTPCQHNPDRMLVFIPNALSENPADPILGESFRSNSCVLGQLMVAHSNQGGNSMRRGVYAAVLAMVGFSVPLHSEMTDEFFIAPNLDPNAENCQTLVLTKWMDLAPGETWELELDMSGCLPHETCALYGNIAKKSSAPYLSSKDGVVMSMYDPGMDSEVRSSNWCSAVSGEETETIVISATNTNRRKTVRIRLTFQVLSN